MNFLLEAQGQPGNPLLGFAPLIIIFILFYMLFLMPQKKEQKKREIMIQNLANGDRIVTSGGLHGVVTEIKDQSVIIKIAENTRVEVGKFAILHLLDKNSSR